MNNQNANTINADSINADSINATPINADSIATTTDKAIAEKIRSQYVSKKQTKLEYLRKLDRKVTRTAEIFAYTFGVVSSLIFGGGMCLAMKVVGNLMPLGIVIGCVGIAMASATYFIYRAIVKKSRNKYAHNILTLTEEIIGE